MANQPTKYRKFVIGAASAALVATAVAPVASAKDFSDMKGNTHEEAVKALSDAGIINGYPDGTFQPNKTLTRSDVVKMMGKWLESLGYKAAEDYKTNPRFSDLTTKTNDELLKYAAIVKDNGVFIGNNGKLDPAGDITRENMALVLVRAFSKVKDVDLVEFVAGQDFKGDVTDLASAKAEAQPAIKVLDYFDITNPAAPAFNPKSTTTRGHFASFLHRAINTDFSDVAVEGVTIKAVNTTTVEVSFKEPVENINSLNFTIEGLEVKNAAVKQTDNKTVVLTTATQKGGEKYTVQMNGEKIGTFEGISAVIPTKIELTTQSVQGKTGQQAVLKADVGVKQAGIPVTFNVEAKGTTLNKDQVFEVLTDENGIATFSYTQYAPGTDEVTAYPTGAPTVRDLGYVFWGVDTILTIEETDKKGKALKNGEDKAYKIKYQDPKTGKPVANKKFHVTFVENVNVNVNEVKNAKVNGVTPQQLLNNSKPVVATIETDRNGEATFTVSGQNTEVTPVVFEEIKTDDAYEKVTYKASKLQAQADKVKFGATQLDYKIDVERKGSEEAAIGKQNGREYEIVVKTKDGKVAANEVLNVALNEDIDRNMNTNTNAKLVKKSEDGVNKEFAEKITVKTDKDGKAKFTVINEDPKGYATPIVWIDINSSNAKEGNFDEGEPHKIAPITYFAEEKVTSGIVKALKNTADLSKDSVKEFKGTEPAYFVFATANQSGKLYNANVESTKATFTVDNTGNEDVTVYYNGGDQVVSAGRTDTFTVDSKAGYASIKVVAENNKEEKKDFTTSVKVTAYGTATVKDQDKNDNTRQVNLGSHTVETKFVSTKEIGTVHTGIVEKVDTEKEKIQFVGKKEISYKDAVSFKNQNGVEIDKDVFIGLVKDNLLKIKVTVKKDKDDKYLFEIVSLDANVSTVTDKVNSAVDTDQVLTALKENATWKAALEKLHADHQKAVAQTVFAAGSLTDNALSTLVQRELNKYVTLSTAQFVKATTAQNGKEAEAVLDVDGDTTTTTKDTLTVKAKNVGTAYNGLKVTFALAEATTAATEVKYDAASKTVTVVLPTKYNAVAQKGELGTVTVNDVVTAIDNAANLDLTATAGNGLVDDNVKDLLNKTITLAGGEDAVESKDATLVLTFSEAVTVDADVKITLDGATTPITVTKAKAEADKDKVTLKLDATQAQNIQSATDVTKVEGIKVDGKVVSVIKTSIQK